jgi:hypothetical protein
MQAAHGAGFSALARGDAAAATGVAARVRSDLENERCASAFVGEQNAHSNANARIRLESSRLPAEMMRHLLREAAAIGSLLRDAEAQMQAHGVLKR